MKLQEKEYEKMFTPQTMGKLKGLSQQAREKQGAKNYGGETMRLASEIARAERGYQDELEQLAVEVVKDAYPIVDKYNIKIDAKIEPMSQNTAIPRGEFQDKPGEQGYSPEEKEDMDAKRRLINALTQGAGVRGSRSFLLMKDYLDSVDPTLVDKYGKILDVALGGYDDENFIAQILAGIANDNNMPGGSSLPEYDKANKQWIVKARAINFPILIHEIVKGIYSVIGSKGWSKNKALNQASVASVDKLRNEPDDLRYGKFMLDAISDAISKFYNKSNVSDPYVRDVFMAKLVELPYPQLRDFIQNAINDELSAGQEKWAKDTINKISSLKEYKVNKPGPHYIIVYNDGTDEIYNLHHFIAPTYQKFKEEFEDMFNQYTFKREIDSKLYLICKDKDEYNDIVNMIERDDSDLEELDDEFKPADETIWKIWPKPKHL